MQFKSLARWTCALLAASAAPAMAQQIPVTDFAKYPELDEVALSPTGEYLATAVPTPDGKETNLQIIRLADGSVVKFLRFGAGSHVVDVTWTNDETITVARAKRFPMVEEPAAMGQLMSTNLDGSAQKTLFAYVEDEGTKRERNKDKGFAYLAKVLDKEPGKALVRYYCWDCGEKADTVVYKVDTATGARQEAERIKDGDSNSSLVFDNDGIARIAYAAEKDGTPRITYRPTQKSEWLPLPKSIAGYQVVGGVFAEDNNTIYARVSDKREATQLYKVDMAAGTRTKVVGSDDVEVGAILTAGRKGLPFGVTYTAHKPSVQYFDNTSPWAQLHAALMKKFPGQMVYFLEFSRDDQKALFWTSSDRVPGNYYVLDRAAGNKIVQVGARKPWFDGKKLAGMKPIEFKSRDGKTLYGFFTAPAGTGPYPLVVMPHGGPFGANDSWGFDSDVQFLASRGYAVLQVNFRGSSGRGDAFETEAYKQWGGMIQDDIADGVKYVIEQKMADPQRVCMYGASFGGYSAMMQPIRNPGMYKCAVGYVGVYDLPMWSRSKDIDASEASERWLDRSLGTDMAVLGDQSPVNHARDIKVPVLLVHGKSDSNVRMGQFKAMESALKEIGQPAEVFLAPGEGHGFSNPDNIAELYRRLETFLDKYIGPGSQTAATQ